MTRRSYDKRVLLMAALLGALAFLAFVPVLRCGFTNFDDNGYVTNNTQVQGGLSMEGAIWALTTMEKANWHPLTWISYMCDYQIYGLEARGFHLTNLLLHIASVILLFLVLGKMTGSVWRSALVAALFAVHPLHVESVAWIAERKDVLSGLFLMLTMGAYAYYVERPTLKRYLLVALFFVCGLMSKPMLVSLPIVLLLLDYWPLRRLTSAEGKQPGRAWRLVLEKVPLFALSAASCVITLVAQRSGGALRTFDLVPLDHRIANALVSYMAYIGKMVVPRGLAVFYPPPVDGIPIWQTTGAALLLILLTCLAFRIRRRAPYFTVGWLWYLVTLIPVIGIVQVGEQAMADRYTYIPLIGLFVIVSWGAFGSMGVWEYGRMGGSPTRPHPHTSAVFAVIVLAALSSLTWIQTGYWRDDVSLYRHALAVTKDNFVALHNLAKYVYDQGQPEEAEELLRRAVEIKPTSPSVHNGLGLALSMQGDYGNAVSEYMEAIRLDPGTAGYHFNLGSTYASAGQLDDAIDQLKQAIEVDPGFTQARTGLDTVYRVRAEMEAGERMCRELLKSDPKSANGYYSLAVILQKQGKLDEAADAYRSAIRFDPSDARAHRNLAVIFFRQEDYALAWKEAHACRKLGFPPHPRFTRALARKMPDPGE